MTKKLYVGNLSFSEGENDLNDLFSQYGAVESVRIITDRESGRSKGFGFVEMAEQESADKAVAELNGTERGGRTIKVNPARPKEQNNSRGGGGGGGRNFNKGGRRY